MTFATRMHAAQTLLKAKRKVQGSLKEVLKQIIPGEGYEGQQTDDLLFFFSSVRGSAALFAHSGESDYFVLEKDARQPLGTPQRCFPERKEEDSFSKETRRLSVLVHR